MDLELEKIRRRYLIISMINLFVLITFGIAAACILNQGEVSRQPLIDLEIFDLNTTIRKN